MSQSATKFSHCGDVGDILSALPTVRAASREHGGGELLICPGHWTRQRMTPAIVASLAPLLERQPYVRSVRYAERPEGVALDSWRWGFPPHPIYSLADRTLDVLGWPHAERGTPWLSVEPDPVARVVFARSPRYRNPRFPWKRVVERYGREAAFVGLREEHDDFVAQFGPVPHVGTPNYLDLARVLAGAELVVVNQTSTFWVAEGLGRNVLLEECPEGHSWNCRHDRPGMWRILYGVEPVPDIGQRGTHMTAAGFAWSLLGRPLVPEPTVSRHYLDRNPEASQFHVSGGGATEAEYLGLLWSLAGIFKPTCILETGTLGGDGTVALMNAADPGATVVTIGDHDPSHADRERLARVASDTACRLVQLRGNTRHMMAPGRTELATATRGRCTFAFLDSSIPDRAAEFAWVTDPANGVMDPSRPWCVCVHDLSRHRHPTESDAEHVEPAVGAITAAAAGKWQVLRLHQSRGMLVLVRYP